MEYGRVVSILLLFRVTIVALRRNLLRSTLTVLGMAVGIAAVITIVALGQGAQAQIEDEIGEAGTNLIYVNAGNRTSGGVRLGMGASSRLTAEDAAALRALPGVAAVSPSIRSRQQLVAGGENWNTTVEGSGADLPLIRSWPVASGRFFDASDVTNDRKVAVLGSATRDKLFGTGVSAVGQPVRIGVQLFRVIGVLTSKGQGAGGRDQDDVVFAPYTTVQKRLMGVTYLNSIAVSSTSAELITPVADRVAALLRVRHAIQPGAPDDFRVRTLEDIVALRSRTTRTMASLLTAVAAVSLLVGGIGVMNIMLVSVTERTREIGLRVAVGARGRDVLLQFLFEAIVIAFAGGVAGVVLGYVLSVALTETLDWRTQMSTEAALIALAVAASTGIFFGWYPARQAASVNPIESLRFE
jgi:putative ABC transport system permease protein